MGLYASPEGDPDDEVLETEDCEDCGLPLDECECGFETHDPDC